MFLHLFLAGKILILPKIQVQVIQVLLKQHRNNVGLSLLHCFRASLCFITAGAPLFDAGGVY
jgi:hypothetical protein